MAALVAFAACACAPPIAEADCHPTVANMTPPAAALDFVVGGSTDPDARSKIQASNWYGNEVMWVILPPRGEIVGRLSDKIPPYRLKYGQVRAEGRRLDGPGVVAKYSMGPADVGFQAGGVGVPETGCWEFTYTLDDQYPLRFTLRVR